MLNYNFIYLFLAPAILVVSTCGTPPNQFLQQRVSTHFSKGCEYDFILTWSLKSFFSHR